MGYHQQPKISSLKYGYAISILRRPFILYFPINLYSFVAKKDKRGPWVLNKLNIFCYKLDL